MRRLYAKLNVHKKQELLDLLENVKANGIQAVRPTGAAGGGRRRGGPVDADGEGGRRMRPEGCNPKGFWGPGSPGWQVLRVSVAGSSCGWRVFRVSVASFLDWQVSRVSVAGPSLIGRVFLVSVAAAFWLAGFPILRSWPPLGWAGFPSFCSRRPRVGRFSEFAGLRAAFRAPRGGFSELLRRRARVSGLLRQVSRVAVANRLHAGSGTRKTCRRSPISVHGHSESRETRHARKRGANRYRTDEDLRGPENPSRKGHPRLGRKEREGSAPILPPFPTKIKRPILTATYRHPREGRAPPRRPRGARIPPEEATDIGPYDAVISPADRTNRLLDFSTRLASSRGEGQALFKLEAAMQVLPELLTQCPKRACTCYSVGFTTVSCILKGVTPRTLCGLPAVMTML